MLTNKFVIRLTWQSRSVISICEVYSSFLLFPANREFFFSFSFYVCSKVDNVQIWCACFCVSLISPVIYVWTEIQYVILFAENKQESRILQMLLILKEKTAQKSMKCCTFLQIPSPTAPYGNCPNLFSLNKGQHCCYLLHHQVINIPHCTHGLVIAVSF